MANIQITATSCITAAHHSSKGNRMHPYLENIRRDMNRTYDDLQAQIRRSRMESTLPTANTNSSQNNNNNNNNNNIKPSGNERITPFSAILESLLNQFSEYQASQENSFQQLSTSLANHNSDNDSSSSSSSSSSNSDNKTIPTSPVDNNTTTAVPVTKEAPPLPVCPLDLMQDDSPRSLALSPNHDMAKKPSPCAGEFSTYASADASSTSAGLHPSLNDQQQSMDKDTNTDKDMGMEVDRSPLTSTPTIAVKETTSLPSLHLTDNVIDIRPASSPPPSVHGNPKDITPLPDSVTIKHESSKSTPPKTTPQPASNTTGSNSSSSSSPKKPSSPTRNSKDPSPLTPIPLPLARPVRTPTPPKPFHVKFNADGSLTLPDFTRQLQQAFDRHPFNFKTDADRIKYAIHCMGDHIARYFEPFLNKTVPGCRKFLKSYHIFLKTLEDKFGKPPSLDAICSATAQLMSLRQTGSMSSYITTFRDLAAVVFWEEPVLIRLFAEGVSPDVKTLLGDPTNIQSLSMLQVAANKAYCEHRTQALSRTVDQNHHHSTSFESDLVWPQEPWRQSDQRPYRDVLDSMAHSTKSPPQTSTWIAPMLSFTSTDTDAVSSITAINNAAIAQANAMIPPVYPVMGTHFKSHARGKLTEEEKQYRKDNNLCLYCGGVGHTSFACPLKRPKDKMQAGHYI